MGLTGADCSGPSTIVDENTLMAMIPGSSKEEKERFSHASNQEEIIWYVPQAAFMVRKLRACGPWGIRKQFLQSAVSFLGYSSTLDRTHCILLVSVTCALTHHGTRHIEYPCRGHAAPRDGQPCC